MRSPFTGIPVVGQNRALREIKSPIILQPGPAALTVGFCPVERHLWQSPDDMGTAR
jgi:hypothetical protein